MNAKETALKLRLAGYSYTYIHEKTGLAKSTLSYHLADVPFTPNSYTLQHQKSAQQKSAKTKHVQKLERLEVAEKTAIQDVGRITKRDILIAGIALYAGEGSKTQNLVRLVNTNPDIIRFFIKWLAVLGVTTDHIAVRVHAYPETDIVKAESYWQHVTGVPKSQFQKVCIDRRVGKDRKRSSVHPYGTAHVTVQANGDAACGTALARRIEAYSKRLLG
jgi:hypothetical protein